MQTFSPGQKVVIKKEFRNLFYSFSINQGIGKGPFSVVDVERVPADEVDLASHSQWLTIETPKGCLSHYSGAYFTHHN